jgi:hypothetical protein
MNLIEIVFNKVFLFHENVKKNVVGHVVFSTPLSGENKQGSNATNAKIVAFYSQDPTLL